MAGSAKLATSGGQPWDLSVALNIATRLTERGALYVAKGSPKHMSDYLRSLELTPEVLLLTDRNADESDATTAVYHGRKVSVA